MASITGILFKLIFENTVLVNSSDLVLPAPSVLSCAQYCTPPCASFFYHETKKCLLTEKRFLTTTDSSLKTDDSWQYYVAAEGRETIYFIDILMDIERSLFSRKNP